MNFFRRGMRVQLWYTEDKGWYYGTLQEVHDAGVVIDVERSKTEIERTFIPWHSIYRLIEER